MGNEFRVARQNWTACVTANSDLLTSAWFIIWILCAFLAEFDCFSFSIFEFWYLV